MIYNSLGNLYRIKKDFDNSIKSIKNGLIIRAKVKFYDNFEQILFTLFDIYVESKNLKQGFKYFSKLLKIFENRGKKDIVNIVDKVIIRYKNLGFKN